MLSASSEANELSQNGNGDDCSLFLNDDTLCLARGDGNGGPHFEELAMQYSVNIAPRHGHDSSSIALESRSEVVVSCSFHRRRD